MKKLAALFLAITFILTPLAPVDYIAHAATDVKNDATLSTDLISYWELEEASGTRVDSHGSNDLTDNNTVTSATAIQGDGADFETGNSEALSISSPTMPTGDMSISVWMKLESTPSGKQYAFWDKYKPTSNQRVGIFQVLNTSRVIETRLWSSTDGLSSGITTDALTVGTWYHVVVTFDSSASTISVYIDGTEASYSGQAKSATNLSTNTNALHIGSRSGAVGTNPFDGVMDEYGMWDKVLSSGEISDLYNSGSGIPYEAAAGASRRIIPVTYRFKHEHTPISIFSSMMLARSDVDLGVKVA